MKNWIIKYRTKILITLVGGIAGGLYYFFAGCASGTCLIASNPFIMIPYTALLAYLFAGIIEKKGHTTSKEA